jgi:hypothetical protein
MNWYLAKIAFQIICGEGHHHPQFDEQLRLIAANDEEEALTKARGIGLKEQDTFLNQHHKLVQWKFIDVSELYKMSDLMDGAELYSRIEEPTDAGTYIDLIHRKAQHIESNATHCLLQLV